MKKRKIKLLASLTSLVLVVAVMAVGVWAATEQAVSVTNTVAFTATKNVKATVALTDIGFDADTTLLKSGTMPDITGGAVEGTTLHTYTANDATTNDTIALGVLELKTTNFEATTIGYHYTITITNTASSTDTNKTLIVTFTDLVEAKTYAAGSYGVVVATSQAIPTEGASANIVNVAIGNPFTYSVTLTIDPNATIDGDATTEGIQPVDLGFAFGLTMGE